MSININSNYNKTLGLILNQNRFWIILGITIIL